MEPTQPKPLEEGFRDIAFIGKYFTFETGNHSFKRLAVIDIARSDFDGHDFTLVVDNQMQFEAKEPAHCAAPAFRQALEDLVSVDASIVADGKLGAVGKIDACLFATKAVQQHTERHHQPWYETDKPTIAREACEAITVFLLNTINPEMFEILEGRKMKQDHDEQALPQRQLARAKPPAARGDQPVAFPVLKGFCKIIETDKKCGVSDRHEGSPYCVAFDP